MGTLIIIKMLTMKRSFKLNNQLRLARIGGVEIPNKKNIESSLQYIYGIGKTTAKTILINTELENKRVFALSEEELTKLRDEVDNFIIEGDLIVKRRFNEQNIRRLKEIACYRGRRHISRLPVNGQRTKTNERTCKGKRKTVAGKKTASR